MTQEIVINPEAQKIQAIRNEILTLKNTAKEQQNIIKSQLFMLDSLRKMKLEKTSRLSQISLTPKELVSELKSKKKEIRESRKHFQKLEKEITSLENKSPSSNSRVERLETEFNSSKTIEMQANLVNTSNLVIYSTLF